MILSPNHCKVWRCAAGCRGSGAIPNEMTPIAGRYDSTVHAEAGGDDTVRGARAPSNTQWHVKIVFFVREIEPKTTSRSMFHHFEPRLMSRTEKDGQE